MSTLGYAALTNARDKAQVGQSSSTSPGVKLYIDALAALVPAEVLTLHGAIISITTVRMDEATKPLANGTNTVPIPTTFIDGEIITVTLAFWGLVALAALLYAGARILNGTWDKWDWLRILIPPFAFTGWTMLQRTTAFDAAFPGVDLVGRSVGALFLAVILGVVATALAYRADQKKPSG